MALVPEFSRFCHSCFTFARIVRMAAYEDQSSFNRLVLGLVRRLFGNHDYVTRSPDIDCIPSGFDGADRNDRSRRILCSRSCSGPSVC
jgi:hypothetical protein